MTERERITTLLYEYGGMCKEHFITEMFDKDWLAADIQTVCGDNSYNSIIIN